MPRTSGQKLFTKISTSYSNALILNIIWIYPPPRQVLISCAFCHFLLFYYHLHQYSHLYQHPYQQVLWNSQKPSRSVFLTCYIGMGPFTQGVTAIQ
jgi:hypothetical protein